MIIELCIEMYRLEWKPFVLKAVKDNWFVIAAARCTGQADLSHPPSYILQLALRISLQNFIKNIFYGKYLSQLITANYIGT